ncbi:unnamed protein product [Spirodela intermedia]|uniref:Alkyl transferase n=1 Tax=Spirodela intermedia TaxID=51605 RepID=A0A7I8ICN3_SPIIN|nr:unnamed protein product [Spirodela intermedia]CAA6654802.1 unnamed protein product [Spirodela intermedia]
MPTHVAFIMDGNRRFTRIRKMETGAGHRAGLTSLIIDNFRRKPEEVEHVMNLMLEKLENLLEEESLVTKYRVRVNFWGNLRMLSEPVRLAIEKAMAATSANTGPVLSVCVAYTSTAEITHAVEESCRERLKAVQEGRSSVATLSVKDVERSLYTAGCPDPDVVIRTSGETRLSNFLLWQTSITHLQNPSVLWPGFSIRHLVWSILEYQRAQPYLEKRKRFNF